MVKNSDKIEQLETLQDEIERIATNVLNMLTPDMLVSGRLPYNMRLDSLTDISWGGDGIITMSFRNNYGRGISTFSIAATLLDDPDILKRVRACADDFRERENEKDAANAKRAETKRNKAEKDAETLKRLKKTHPELF